MKPLKTKGKGVRASMKREIYTVTGGTGMVGRDLQALMPEYRYLSRQDYNLKDQNEVTRLFNDLHPDGIIHLAATVGGIQDNIRRPVDYLEDNILINTMMLAGAYRYNLKTFVGILSSCIYPDKVKIYPMTEKEMHHGPPAATNFSYAMAKRALAVQIEAYNRQHGTNYFWLAPCNMYGSHDKYGERDSHFVASLIKKIYHAKVTGTGHINLFGTGNPLRQFMYSADFARVISECLQRRIYVNMNVACDEEYTIDQIARIALKACDAENLEIKYDESKPDGQFRKTISNALFRKHFPDFKFTSLFDGIKKTYEFYHNQISKK